MSTRSKTFFKNGDITCDPEATTGPLPLPVVSCDQAGTPSLLKPIQAFRWFIDYGGRPGTGWENRGTRVIPKTPVLYHPFLCAPLSKCRYCLWSLRSDKMVHADYNVAKETYEHFLGPKE